MAGFEVIPEVKYRPRPFQYSERQTATVDSNPGTNVVVKSVDLPYSSCKEVLQ